MTEDATGIIPAPEVVEDERIRRLWEDHDEIEEPEWARGSVGRVYVVTQADSPVVLGYYALAAGSVELADAPGRARRGVGRHPIPVVLLARLGVLVEAQGAGLGAALVRDALRRVESAADVIGIRALLIHAKSDRARLLRARRGVRAVPHRPAPPVPAHEGPAAGVRIAVNRGRALDGSHRRSYHASYHE